MPLLSKIGKAVAASGTRMFPKTPFSIPTSTPNVPLAPPLGISAKSVSAAATTSKTFTTSNGYLSQGLGAIAAHPTIAGAGIGAMGGFLATGSVGGALAGAALGGIGGRRGWITNDFNQAGRLHQQVGAGLGKQFAGIKNINSITGMGSQRLGMMATGLGMTAGAGALGGFGASAVGGMIGSTFGSERRSHYGTTFSGMGNGTITGY
jgi:hypothetical protein